MVTIVTGFWKGQLGEAQGKLENKFVLSISRIGFSACAHKILVNFVQQRVRGRNFNFGPEIKFSLVIKYSGPCRRMQRYENFRVVENEGTKKNCWARNFPNFSFFEDRILMRKTLILGEENSKKTKKLRKIKNFTF